MHDARRGTLRGNAAAALEAYICHHGEEGSGHSRNKCHDGLSCDTAALRDAAASIK